MRFVSFIVMIAMFLGTGIIKDSYAGKKEREKRRSSRKKMRSKRKAARNSLKQFWRQHKSVCLGDKRDKKGVLKKKRNLEFCCYKLRNRLVKKGVAVGTGVAAATFLTGGAATAASWGGSMKIAAVAAAKGSSASTIGVATGAAGVASGTQSKRILKEGKMWDKLACKDVYVDIKKRRKTRRQKRREK